MLLRIVHFGWLPCFALQSHFTRGHVVDSIWDTVTVRKAPLFSVGDPNAHHTLRTEATHNIFVRRHQSSAFEPQSRGRDRKGDKSSKRSSDKKRKNKSAKKTKKKKGQPSISLALFFFFPAPTRMPNSSLPTFSPSRTPIVPAPSPRPVLAPASTQPSLVPLPPLPVTVPMPAPTLAPITVSPTPPAGGVPPNDLCTQATAVQLNTPMLFGTTVNATSQNANDCTSRFTNTNAAAPEVFYRIIGNGRRLSVSTCSPATDFPTALILWQGKCGGATCAVGATTLDSTCADGNAARITWESIAGQPYTLLVYGRQVGSKGNFGLSLSDFINPRNDYCTQAETLPINGPQVVGTTVNATSQNANDCTSRFTNTNAAAPEVFYTVVGNGKNLTATTCSNATNFPTTLILWKGQCNSVCSVGAQTVDRSCTDGNAARLTWLSSQNQVYTLLVYGRQASTAGQFGLSIQTI